LIWADNRLSALAAYPASWTFRRGRSRGGPPRSDALFGLAPRGVCTAVAVARNAVSSYLTISPLPNPLRGGGIFSVALSVVFRLAEASDCTPGR